MNIKIDKGIPMPSGYKYPFAEMEVGDSFFAPGVNLKTISGSIGQASRKLLTKYRVRTVDGGVRVWRIE